MILLAYDYTLHDIERFCTQPDNFRVFGVDPKPVRRGGSGGFT